MSISNRRSPGVSGAPRKPYVLVRVSSNPSGALPSEFRTDQVPGDAAQDREQQSVQGFAQRSEPKIHAAFEFICHALLLLKKTTGGVSP